MVILNIKDSELYSYVNEHKPRMMEIAFLSL